MAAFKIGAKVKSKGITDTIAKDIVYTVVDVKFLKDKNIHVHGLVNKEGEKLPNRWSDKFLTEIVVLDEFKGNF